ncbi:MAG TPA: flagellar hook capping FlgD N-terminal domain-containing protein [Solirubrobacteraceae bacterium]|nr:flagellar hook capping FlgD N-terminal domain-containing protein [Solirubrobacteraceae bacterium]
MTTINPTAQAAITSGAGAGGNTPTENSKGMLGQNDFLKLMIAQLQAQDPLQPANTNEYISELAQFTQVEQTTNLANANELSGAVQLIGRTVAYNNPAGGSATGIVQSVQSSASGTSVTIEGVSGVKLASITEVL